LTKPTRSNLRFPKGNKEFHEKTSRLGIMLWVVYGNIIQILLSILSLSEISKASRVTEVSEVSEVSKVTWRARGSGYRGGGCTL